MTTTATAALLAAVADFKAGVDVLRIGYLSHTTLGDHVHVYRRSPGVTALYAIAVPDPHLAARITVTGVCPLCEPARYATVSPDVAARYVVEHAMED